MKTRLESGAVLNRGLRGDSDVLPRLGRRVAVVATGLLAVAVGVRVLNWIGRGD